MASIPPDLTPEEIKEAQRQLWYKGNLQWKLDTTQLEMYHFIRNAKKKTSVINCSRRLGKCLGEDVEVMTPNGPVPIKDLKVGDTVYGLNSDGSVSPTMVIAHEFTGVKMVTELTKNGRVLATSSDEHRWPVNDSRTAFKIKEKTIKEFTSTDKIHRRLVEIPCGNVRNPHAYSIGLILGDGCSRQGVKQIHVSSEYEEPIKAVAGELNCDYWRQSDKNYTWALSVNPKGKGTPSKYSPSTQCNYYLEWCKDKYAHEKIVDINVINTWDRESLLAFLAGLIDSDGSVANNGNILTIQFTNQSKSVIDAFQYAFYKLFQYKPTIIEDKRSKYKNGPVYQISIRNNFFCKRALWELDRHIRVPKKKWQESYENLNERSENGEYVGVKLGKSYEARTYDIQVDNETSLFILANGLVTHNSYLLTIIAVEQCIKKKGSIVKFLQPEQKQIRVNIRPIMDEILKDCPVEIKPVFKTMDNIYKFPNGSEIQLAGTDNGNAEKIRGGDADYCLVDEAAFVKAELEYIVKSILLPTTTITRGKIILSSTSPKESDHDFKRYMEQAILTDAFMKKTIYDARDDESNWRITPEVVEEIIAEYIGGVNNDHFRREYLCEIISDGNNAVVPEFSDELADEIVSEWPKPVFYDRYVAMDIGFKDLTVVLFGYYDFQNAVVVIEDEIVMNGPQMTTDRLAEEIRNREKQLWTDNMTGEYTSPYLRVSDNNLVLLNDLQRLHGITFMPTLKDNKEAAINNMRNLIQQHRVVINPRCKTLISHLRNATWNKRRTEYNRSPDDGHYDAVDALVYMLRNVNFNKNPFPRGYRSDGIGGPGSFFSPTANATQRSGLERDLERMFQRKSSVKTRKK